MSRYSRLPTVGSSFRDDRIRQPSSNAAQTTFKLEGTHGEEVYRNGTGQGKVTKDFPRHRRVVSGSEISLKRLRDGHMLETQLRDESTPEVILDAPLEDMDETERRTWQIQWADALKKVQARRHSGARTQSARWSGVATDIYRPKSLTTQDAQHASSARKSHGPAASLDQWNYYPGPSVNRDISQSPQDNTIRENDACNNSLLGKTISNAGVKKFGRSTTGILLKGRGSKSITTFEKLDDPLEATQSTISGSNIGAAQQGRGASAEHLAANSRPQVMHQTSNSGYDLTTPSLDQFMESQRPKSHSAAASGVQRTQSHRYGRIWGQKAEAKHLLDMTDSNSGAHQNAAVPNPSLKKAISMREGGAHADAVMEMARAYSETVCGVPKALECASCGRNLGIIVQGNPGVDIAFCQACRPSPLQWKKAISDNASGFKRKKGIMQFCRKILRLDKRSS